MSATKIRSHRIYFTLVVISVTTILIQGCIPTFKYHPGTFTADQFKRIKGSTLEFNKGEISVKVSGRFGYLPKRLIHSSFDVEISNKGVAPVLVPYRSVDLTFLGDVNEIKMWVNSSGFEALDTATEPAWVIKPRSKSSREFNFLDSLLSNASDHSGHTHHSCSFSLNEIYQGANGQIIKFQADFSTFKP